MRTAVVVFPGSNCDRDMAVALHAATGQSPHMVWHRETALPDGLDLIALPGGFSFGDYLRCGAVAARSPIMAAVINFAQQGGLLLGVCNGFQILVEAGLLPGAFVRNRDLRFVCRDVHLRVETTDGPFTNAYPSNAVIRIPIAHADGAYFAPPETLAELQAADRIAFRYVAAPDSTDGNDNNPNGSVDAIAGVLSENRRVLGMMPHPERLADPALGGTDGAKLFASLAAAMAAT